MGGSRGRLISESDRSQAIQLINQACDAGARKHKACEILGITLRTYERWHMTDGLTDKRTTATKVPTNKLTKAERQQLLSLANSKEYCDLPPSQIVPKLADLGIYVASEATWYRVLREEKMLQHRGASQPVKHKKPAELIATSPNQIWSWDISYLPTQIRGLFNYLYMIIDIYSRKIVGWSIHTEESASHASSLAIQACIDEKINPKQIVLHSDNGSPMKGATMLATLQKLGVMPSFSRPSVSNDNPYSEALFRTLKYRPNYTIGKFTTLEEANEWVDKFVHWYNTEHLHSGLKFITPQQRHNELDNAIFAGRIDVYNQAKQRHPERWSGKIRNWELQRKVILNPGKTQKTA